LTSLTVTITADAEDLVPVGIHVKAMSFRDLALEFFDRPAGKLHNDTTHRADHVVVVVVLESVLESSQTILELDGLRQFGVAEKLQGSINRCSSDLGMSTLNDLVEIVNRRMSFRVEKVLENNLTLSRMLEFVFQEITFEYFELFSTMQLSTVSHLG
jgi:hypothetical protein